VLQIEIGAKNTCLDVHPVVRAVDWAARNKDSKLAGKPQEFRISQRVVVFCKEMTCQFLMDNNKSKQFASASIRSLDVLALDQSRAVDSVMLNPVSLIPNMPMRMNHTQFVTVPVQKMLQEKMVIRSLPLNLGEGLDGVDSCSFL